MLRDSKTGRFVSTGKFVKIDGHWYRSLCVECGKNLKGYNTQRCQTCRVAIQTKPQNFKHTTKHSDVTKKAISQNRTGKGLHPGVRYHDLVGDKHWNWQGGKTAESVKIRASYEYKRWRKAVFERDNFTCTECGQVGGYLEADHIKQFAHYPKLRLDIRNGRTLCKTCHRSTKTFGRPRRDK